MKEYIVGEDGREFNPSGLEAGRMSRENYVEAHRGLVIPCHDIMIEYSGGLLLVVRKEYPGKNLIWPIGGRVLRGMPMETSLRKKVLEECGLEIEDLEYLDVARSMWETDPFGHGRGTDTFSVRYFGIGKGRINLNEVHTNPLIVRPEQYTLEFRSKLHICVRDHMDMAMPKVRK